MEIRSLDNQNPPSLTEHENRNPQPRESQVPELASKAIQVLALTNTVSNRKLIEASIVADAAQAIAQSAMNDRRRGVAIDRWYFEDTKWRPTGKVECGKSNAAPPASEGIKRELQERREIWNRRAAAGIQ